MKAREAFKRFFKGNKNFMTPYIKGYYQKKLKDKIMYFELSEGTGINNEPIFGVTVLIEKEGKLEHATKLSKLFWDEQEAKNYINKLKERKWQHADLFNSHGNYGSFKIIDLHKKTTILKGRGKHE